MFKLRLFFCVCVCVASSVSSSVVKRGHHDPWAPRDCWDHGFSFLMNPFCPVLAACEKPPKIVHGRYSDPELTLTGLKVVYTCNLGYTMIGRSEVTCAQPVDMSNHVWGAAPRCVKLCPAPSTIQFGTYSAPEVAVPGSQANYTCNDGYRFDSENTSVVCEATGDWSSPTPACVPKECPLPPAIDFGSPASNDTAVGSLVEYDCLKGYSFRKEATATCLPGGIWTSPLPTCIPPDCSPIATIDNGSPVGSKLRTTYGNSVDYVCDDGYKFTDTNATSCLITGYWSVLPECVRIITGCGPVPLVQNANISESSNNTDVGALELYQCVDGYELIGNETVECLSTFEWSVTPRCGIVCGDLPEIAFGGAVGYQSLSNDSLVGYQLYSNGTSVDYECEGGYILNGPSAVECVDGNWTEAPFCKANCVDIDVVFLVDGSGSVGEFGFQDTRDFLTNMVGLYPRTTTRFGLATFSTGVSEEFNMNKYIGNTAGLRAALANIKYPTGNTNTGTALEYARTNMFQEKNGMRPDALRAAIVVTDGESNHPNKTLEQAELLKAQNVTIYSVGVGIETNPAELRAIASNDNYVFNVSDYSAIKSVAGPLSARTCTVLPGAVLTDEDETDI